MLFFQVSPMVQTNIRKLDQTRDALVAEEESWRPFIPTT